MSLIPPSAIPASYNNPPDPPPGQPNGFNLGGYADVPVDPRDCARFPNSVFCGPPIAPAGAGLALGPFNIDFGYDQCQYCVKLNPTLTFGIKAGQINIKTPLGSLDKGFGVGIDVRLPLPDGYICNKFANCADPPPPDPPDLPTPRPPNPPTRLDNPFPNKGNSSCCVYMVIYDWGDGQTAKGCFYCYGPFDHIYTDTLFNERFATTTYNLAVVCRGVSLDTTFFPFLHINQLSEDEQGLFFFNTPVSDERLRQIAARQFRAFYYNRQGETNMNKVFSFSYCGERPKGNLDLIGKDYFEEPFTSLFYNYGRGPIRIWDIIPLNPGEQPVYFNYYQNRATNPFTQETVSACGSFDSRIPPDPPLPPDNCMECCENLLPYLKRIYYVLGCREFPGKVPISLIKDKSIFGGLQVSINHYAELFTWIIKQVDALAGEFPIEIEIEDIDKTKKGNQSQKLTFPNISEMLAEMMGLVINGSINSEALINITSRALIQAGSATVAATQAKDAAYANSEYLGYQRKESKRKLNLVYTPDTTPDNQALELDEILKESEVEIHSIENTDKDDLQDVLQTLTMAARIIQAVNYRKVDTSGDIKEGIKQLYRDLLDQSEKQRTTDDDDWDKFTESLERGFIDIPGMKDQINPYGRPIQQRPRIRDIGKQSEG